MAEMPVFLQIDVERDVRVALGKLSVSENDVVVLSYSPEKYAKGDLEAYRKCAELVRNYTGAMVLVAPFGNCNIETLNEDQMRSCGWQRIIEESA